MGEPDVILAADEGRGGEVALKICEKVYGTEHPNTARVLNNLAGVLRDLGEIEQADRMFARAIAIGEKAMGAGHLLVQRFQSGYALLLLRTGREAEALRVAETALTVHEASNGPDHVWTKDSARRTADALEALGRADEAAALRARYGLGDGSGP